MTKIKIHNMDKVIDEHIKKFSSFMPNLNDSLTEEFIQIKSLLKTGVLTKDSYGLFKEQYKNNFELNMSLHTFRELYVHNYGFFLVSEDFLEKSVEFFSKNKILEVGAGTGFLSACLQGYGIDITPTDLHVKNNSYGFINMHTDVLEVNSVDYLKNNRDKFDTVLMSWPDYTSNFAYNILESMNSGQTLIYIGEGYGGCTADDDFFDRLSERAELMEPETKEINENSFSWFGIHDRVKVYKIK